MFKSCPCCGADLESLAEAAFPKAKNKIVRRMKNPFDNMAGAIGHHLSTTKVVAGEHLDVGVPVFIDKDQNVVKQQPKTAKYKRTPGLKRRGRLTSERAAQIIGIDQSGMCKMRKRGTGPRYDLVAGKYWYKYDDVMEFKRSRKESKKHPTKQIVEAQKEAVSANDF